MILRYFFIIIEEAVILKSNIFFNIFFSKLKLNKKF
jgi:hypothetical protein